MKSTTFERTTDKTWSPFVIFGVWLWVTVIMQKAKDGFYLEEMLMRVTQYS